MSILRTVTFHRHDTLAQIGAAVPYLRLSFASQLSGEGGASLEVNAADICGVTQRYTDSQGTATLWNRPCIVRVWDGATNVFTWQVEGYDWSFREDSLDPWTGKVTFTGRGIAGQLQYKTVITVANGHTTTYIATPRAAILRTLFLDTAAGRPSGVGMLSLGFSAALDSNGVAWADADDVVVRSGGTLLDLLKSWAQYGYDWQVSATGVLNLWQTKGAVLGTTIPATDLLGAPKESGDFRSLISALWYEPTGQFTNGQLDAPAAVIGGYREQLQSIGGARGASADAVALSILSGLKRPAVSRTVAISAYGTGPRPYAGLDFGDTITIAIESPFTGLPGGAASTAARALGWSWDIDAINGVERIELQLDSVLELRRDRWVSGLESSQGTLDSNIIEGASVSTNDGTPNKPWVQFDPVVRPGKTAYYPPGA